MGQWWLKWWLDKVESHEVWAWHLIASADPLGWLTDESLRLFCGLIYDDRWQVSFNFLPRHLRFGIGIGNGILHLQLQFSLTRFLRLQLLLFPMILLLRCLPWPLGFGGDSAILVTICLMCQFGRQPLSLSLAMYLSIYLTVYLSIWFQSAATDA